MAVLHPGGQGWHLGFRIFPVQIPPIVMFAGEPAPETAETGARGTPWSLPGRGPGDMFGMALLGWRLSRYGAGPAITELAFDEARREEHVMGTCK